MSLRLFDSTLNAHNFLDHVKLLDPKKDPKFASVGNMLAWWAASIGHEMYHIAIGDAGTFATQAKNTDPLVATGAVQPGHEASAHRVHAKIISELLYNGKHYLTINSPNDPQNPGWGYSELTIPNNSIVTSVLAHAKRIRINEAQLKRILNVGGRVGEKVVIKP